MTERDNILILNVDDQDAPRYVKTRDLQRRASTSSRHGRERKRFD